MIYGHRGPRSSKFQMSLQQLLLAVTAGLVVVVLCRHWWLGQCKLFSSISFNHQFFSRVHFSDAGDPYKCHALLNGGRWLSPTVGSTQNQTLQVWQPPGCMMHTYQARDIVACLKSERIVFVGDSTVRQIFWETAKKVDQQRAKSMLALTDKHSDLHFEEGGVVLDYLWDPFLNSSRLHSELTQYSCRESLSGDDALSDINRARPSLILFGGGLWFSKELSVDYLGRFKDAVDAVVRQTISSMPNERPCVRDEAMDSNNLLILTPVQTPHYEALSSGRSVELTPARIDPMNEHLQDISRSHDIDVTWSYLRMTSNQTAAYDESGLHVQEAVAAKKADIILNLRCNARYTKQADHFYPNDRTCCVPYGKSGWIKLLVLFLGLGVFPGLCWTNSRGWFFRC